jgi:hypothetical protein
MTQRALEYFDVGEPGLAYMRRQFEDARALGAALLEIVDHGEALTRAPPGTSFDQLYAFEAGGLLPENLDMSRAFQLEGGSKMMAVVSLFDERLELIQGVMRATPGNICIADDVNPTWPEHRERAEATAFGVGAEVYHIAHAGASLEDIENALVGILPWHGITAVCRGPLAISDERECEPDAFRRAALSATLITCSAYDGEGFVAWRKKG